mmetsp:Transcript_9265/g.25054  ORF Transcript_9265/g.25054 Transcript_9265/m.25054 type:complete len:490 (+) Transcript_9265:141-1610(+)
MGSSIRDPSSISWISTRRSSSARRTTTARSTPKDSGNSSWISASSTTRTSAERRRAPSFPSRPARTSSSRRTSRRRISPSHSTMSWRRRPNRQPTSSFTARNRPRRVAKRPSSIPPRSTALRRTITRNSSTSSRSTGRATSARCRAKMIRPRPSDAPGRTPGRSPPRWSWSRSSRRLMAAPGSGCPTPKPTRTWSASPRNRCPPSAWSASTVPTRSTNGRSPIPSWRLSWDGSIVAIPIPRTRCALGTWTSCRLTSCRASPISCTTTASCMIGRRVTSWPSKISSSCILATRSSDRARSSPASGATECPKKSPTPTRCCTRNQRTPTIRLCSGFGRSPTTDAPTFATRQSRPGTAVWTAPAITATRCRLAKASRAPSAKDWSRVMSSSSRPNCGTRTTSPSTCSWRWTRRSPICNWCTSMSTSSISQSRWNTCPSRTSTRRSGPTWMARWSSFPTTCAPRGGPWRRWWIPARSWRLEFATSPPSFCGRS